MNPRLRSWFEDGKIAEALIGSGPYFIYEPTWGTHARTLAFSQLLAWAEEKDAYGEATIGFEKALYELAKLGQVDEVFDVAWCYLIVSEDSKLSLPYDQKAIRAALQTAKKNAPTEFLEQDELQKKIKRVEDKFNFV